MSINECTKHVKSVEAHLLFAESEFGTDETRRALIADPIHWWAVGVRDGQVKQGDVTAI